MELSEKIEKPRGYRGKGKNRRTVTHVWEEDNRCPLPAIIKASGSLLLRTADGPGSSTVMGLVRRVLDGPYMLESGQLFSSVTKSGNRILKHRLIPLFYEYLRPVNKILDKENEPAQFRLLTYRYV